MFPHYASQPTAQPVLPHRSLITEAKDSASCPFRSTRIRMSHAPQPPIAPLQLALCGQSSYPRVHLHAQRVIFVYVFFVLVANLHR